MKKDNLAVSHSHSAQPEVTKCELAVAGHEHLHAANCGHKSYVHAGHVCYEHDGHFHYMHDGHAHACPGPKAQPGINRSTTSVATTGKIAPVLKLPTAASNKTSSKASSNKGGKKK